jgi:hypothetical protein
LELKDVSVPIFVQEHAGIKRLSEPVRIGVPFPRAAIRDTARLELKGSTGGALPSQVRPLDYWPDKSIKWALLDFFPAVEANSQAVFTLNVEDHPVPEPESPEKISISVTPNGLIADTGAAVFSLSRNGMGPLNSVSVDGVEILQGSGSQTRLKESGERTRGARVDSLKVEETGLLRCAFKLEGKFTEAGKKDFCNFSSRLTFFAGLPVVAMEFTIHNPRAALHPGGLWDLGDPGSLFFTDLSMIFHLAGHSRSVEWISETNGAINTCLDPDWSLYQDSSGGENWNSPNHVDRQLRIALSFRGYRVLQGKGGRREAIAEGERATPYAKVNTSSGWLAATVEDFWQNFPKSLRAENGTFSIGIFPAENPFGFELQGGERKRHTLFLDFGREDRHTIIPQFQNPLHVFIDPEWIENSQAIACFALQKEDRNTRYLHYVENVIDGPNSFFNKREAIDEYGWRNFGDIYADHEAVNHRGPGKLISHYNNQYDFIYGAGVHFMRSGDRRWFRLMRDAARHTIDIDIYHTDEDKAAYNHGMFWHTDHYRDAGACTHRTFSRRTLNEISNRHYGGGPCNEHNYTSGLLQYFCLTGDPDAGDAVLELAQWVIAMDDGAQTMLGFIDDGPTGLASSTAEPDFHGPGRGAGNSINALMDAYRLTGSRKYFMKAEELIQRCIHPKDDIGARRLDDPEHRWSYLVFLQVLGKYLDFKVELEEIDYCFHYARESLLHYADWMMENEVPYKEVLHKVEIPTETWPAQDIRKCCALHFAARYGRSADRHKYSERAGFFFERCLEDTASFETAHLTRPLVILTVCGFVHAYFQNGERLADIPGNDYDFGLPEEFLPQRARLKNSLLNKSKVVFRQAARTLMGKLYAIRARI